MIGWLIFLVVALPILLFGVFFLLAAARVRIDAGTVGLLIVRGAATSKALEPGIHYTWPYRHHMIQRYPLREQTYLAIEGAAGAAAPPAPPVRTASPGSPAPATPTPRPAPTASPATSRIPRSGSCSATGRRRPCSTRSASASVLPT